MSPTESAGQPLVIVLLGPTASGKTDLAIALAQALDLAVLPGWRAVLPIGPCSMLPVATHPQLLRDPAALRPLARELLRP